MSKCHIVGNHMLRLTHGPLVGIAMTTNKGLDEPVHMHSPDRAFPIRIHLYI